MRDINNILQRGAQDRLKDIIQYVKDLDAQPKVKELVAPWGIRLNTDPVKVEG
jgi:hypothetical protein